MLIRLWRGSAATHGPGPMRDKNNTRGIENKVRITRMIIIVIVVFAVCWLPLQIVLLLKAFDRFSNDVHWPIIIQIFAHCLAYCNSCLNPILYAFFSTNYRAAFWNIISCGKWNGQRASALPAVNDGVAKANGHNGEIGINNKGHKGHQRHVKISQNQLEERYELQPMVTDEMKRMANVRTFMIF